MPRKIENQGDRVKTKYEYEVADAKKNVCGTRYGIEGRGV